MILPVILAGGLGTRLWPLSRSLHPKQFLPLNGGQTLLQQTVQRLPIEDNVLPPLIVCHEAHRFLVAQQLHEANVKHSGILLEPVSKNTGPAIALAAHVTKKTFGENIILLILPADHHIGNVQVFHDAIQQAITLARTQHLVMLGIRPTRPDTGYGYMHQGAPVQASAGYSIKAFIEKPPLEMAKRFVDSSEYLWNAGIFVFATSSILSEFQQYESDLYQITQKASHSIERDRDFIRMPEGCLTDCPNTSIDYAIMEKTQKGAVVPLESEWNDLGTWDALWAIAPKDCYGNAIEGRAIVDKTQHSFIYSKTRLITALGVENLIIADTQDALLVADRGCAQQVKDIVAKLHSQHAPESDQHTQEYRPWGWFESLSKKDRHHVKRLFITPGNSISLQLHHHRSEHWVVVRGIAKVMRGEAIFTLCENESTFIPVGMKHRLENIGNSPLEVIEVQSGEYLGEDDIVRFADQHGRAVTAENSDAH